MPRSTNVCRSGWRQNRQAELTGCGAFGVLGVESKESAVTAILGDDNDDIGRASNRTVGPNVARTEYARDLDRPV